MARNRPGAAEAFDGLFGGKEDESIGTSTISERMFAEKKGETRPVTDIPIEDLIEDPDNHKIYGNYDTDGLADSIKENGFKGVIFAYPSKEFYGKYQIESGHRSLEAAKKAGLSKVPVMITDRPKDNIERRKRLVLANLHNRVYTPIMMAEQAGYLYETYRMESDRLRTEGKKLPEEINTLIAKDLEVSRALVLKYRQLLMVCQELKDMADSGEYGWSAIAEAATLPESEQKRLAELIKNKSEKDGISSCTRKWIEEEIKKLRLGLREANIDKDNKTTSSIPKRRVDSMKYIDKTSSYLEKAFGEGSYIKPESVEEARRKLEQIKDMVEKKLLELNSYD